MRRKRTPPRPSTLPQHSAVANGVSEVRVQRWQRLTAPIAAQARSSARTAPRSSQRSLAAQLACSA